MYRYIAMMIVLLGLASCGQPKDVKMVKSSPDGKVTLTITGRKASALDPFQVSMSVRAGDIPEGSLTFEIAADDLNDSNVRLDWSDPQHAVITFTQRDGEPRIFTLAVSETSVLLAPVIH
ncbi:MAG: hypothetical protein JST76_15165 [Bacteroidetes bacterium]|nr:hypothetical protein [Bacteroidota bacterium]